MSIHTVHSVGKTDLPKEDPSAADKVEETSSSLDDDWEIDPANPRNWPIGKKWVATAIVNPIIFFFLLLRLIFFFFQVSLYTFVSPLGTSMMAPGLPELATMYGITNPTVLAMTLSIFLVSFAIGVRAIYRFILNLYLPV